MKGTRVGFGYDAHRFGGEGPVVLCGVDIDHSTGVEATSDGDVACHAIIDALLGAAAMGDIGSYFPSDDPQWTGARSVDLLRDVVTKIIDRGFDIVNTDVTIVAQSVRVSPFKTDTQRARTRDEVAAACRVPKTSVSVKATTTDGLGWIGAGEGLAAQAVVSLQR